MIRLNTMVEFLKSKKQNQPVEPKASIEPASETSEYQPEPTLFVATDLEYEDFTVGPLVSDIYHDSKTYRRFGLEYLAYLRTIMKQAKSAHQAGTLSNREWDRMYDVFCGLHEYAVEYHGKDAVREAYEYFDIRIYESPNCLAGIAVQASRKWIFPLDETLPCIQPVSFETLAKVDAIRDEAMAKGWSKVRLYQNKGRYKFPCGDDYGLVCFVDGDSLIGNVTERYIEIVHGPNSPRPCVLKFRNQKVSEVRSSKE